MTENLTANIITDTSRNEIDWRLDRGAVALMMGVKPHEVDSPIALMQGQQLRRKYVKRLGHEVGAYDVIVAEAQRRGATLTMDGVTVVDEGKYVTMSADDLPE